jgi:hypothetical protein
MRTGLRACPPGRTAMSGLLEYLDGCHRRSGRWICLAEALGWVGRKKSLPKISPHCRRGSRLIPFGVHLSGRLDDQATSLAGRERCAGFSGKCAYLSRQRKRCKPPDCGKEHPTPPLPNGLNLAKIAGGKDFLALERVFPAGKIAGADLVAVLGHGLGD